MAWWQSGYAEDCKSLYAGSIPTQASKIIRPMNGRFVLNVVILIQTLYYRTMIEKITLYNFRNHASCRVRTYGHHNIIITGPNGAGKTAILEAISMLSGDRGLRSAPMTDIAKFNGDGGFSVTAELNDDSEINVYFMHNDNNRRVRIDGDAATLSDLNGKLRMIWFTPREDRLFVDSAVERRAFFDRLISSFDPLHGGRVVKLSKLLSERAFAIKNGNDSKWLNALDEQIAGTAVAIAASRIQYAGELNYFLNDCAVTVSGEIEKQIIGGTTISETERNYLLYLQNNRELIGDKMILDGPHKSDFGVFNKILNLPASLTSTGQQKTVLLDLILAHAKLIHAKTNRRPIILLDEAAAHLDKDSRKRLFSELGKTDAQVWATGLDADVFLEIPDAIFVTCKNGEISNIVVAGNKNE